MYIPTNTNPNGYHIDDCVIRAISIAENKSWDYISLSLAMHSFDLKGMSSTNFVWDDYLRMNGYIRSAIPNSCPRCYTVKDFCEDHPTGIYILATGSHVVTVIDGDYYDTWDSGYEVPIYYYIKKEDGEW